MLWIPINFSFFDRAELVHNDFLQQFGGSSLERGNFSFAYLSGIRAESCGLA